MRTKHRRHHGREHVRSEHPFVMLFLVMIIALGVVGTAYVMSQKSGMFPWKTMRSAARDAGTSQAQAPSSSSTSTETVLLLLNQDSATLVRMDGTQERIPRGDLVLRFNGLPYPIEGTNVTNGSVVAYPEMATGSRPGARFSPDGAYAAHLADPRADGATAVVLKPKGGSERTVVLREGNSPLRDGALAGWFDAHTMAVVAYTASTKAVYAAGIDGSLRKLEALPDTVTMSAMRDGMFWYMTGTDAGGIELPPRGPSDLHRVSMDGKDAVMAHEDAQVIVGVMGEGRGRTAYATDDGHSVIVGTGVPGGRIDLGRRRPIAILPDGKLVLRDEYALVAFDPQNGSSSALADVPEGDVQAFIATMPVVSAAP